MRNTNLLFSTLIILLTIFCYTIWEGIHTFNIEVIFFIEMLCICNIVALILILKKFLTYYE